MTAIGILPDLRSERAEQARGAAGMFDKILRVAMRAGKGALEFHPDGEAVVMVDIVERRKLANCLRGGIERDLRVFGEHVEVAFVKRVFNLQREATADGEDFVVLAKDRRAYEGHPRAAVGSPPAFVGSIENGELDISIG